MTALATVGELENHVQRPVDPEVGGLALELASGVVHAYCGWGLVEETVTLFADTSEGGPVVNLPTLRLVAVDKISVAGKELPYNEDPWVYPRWSMRGQLFHPLGWQPNTTVAVDCTHGYDTLPSLVRLVVLDLAAKQLNNPQGLTSMTVGQVSRTYATGGSAEPSAMSALHMRLLDRYTIF